MAVNRSTGMKNAMLGQDSFRGLFEGGCIKIFAGVQPTDADQDENVYNEFLNATGTNYVLATISTSHLAYNWEGNVNGLIFDAPEAGMITTAADGIWSGIGDTYATFTGKTATWFRFYPGGLKEMTTEEKASFDILPDVYKSDHQYSAHSGPVTFDGDVETGIGTYFYPIRFDGDCGTFGSLRMSSTTVTEGRTITIDSFQIELG